jgi:hypothetical protein
MVRGFAVEAVSTSAQYDIPPSLVKGSLARKCSRRIYASNVMGPFHVCPFNIHMSSFSSSSNRTSLMVGESAGGSVLGSAAAGRASVVPLVTAMVTYVQGLNSICLNIISTYMGTTQLICSSKSRSKDKEYHGWDFIPPSSYFFGCGEISPMLSGQERRTTPSR